jgi:drug/metabolite transporter (DMT)-like permease
MGLQFWPIATLPKEIPQGSVVTSTTSGYVAAILCWLLSAGVYIAAKAVATEMPPWALCFWRIALAGLILSPVVFSHWAAVVLIVRQRWPALLAVGGLGLAITQGLMFTGLNYTSAINAGLILALTPIITMIFARFLLDERIGPWQVIGSLVALFGMVTIILRGDLLALLRLDLNPGELLIVGAAACFALYTVFLRKAKFDLAPLPLLVVLLAGALVTALPFYLWEVVHDERTALNFRGLASLAYTAGPGGALMYYLFNRSIKALGASKAGVFLYLQTVFVAILAYFFLGERLLAYHLVGGVFVLIGVVLIVRFKPRVAM